MCSRTACIHSIPADINECDLCPAAFLDDARQAGFDYPSASALDTLQYLVDETLCNLADLDRIALNTIRFGASFELASVVTTSGRLGKLRAVAERFEQLAESTL